MAPLAAESDVHYTVFVRLPFPRGAFIDPPPANWDAVKDRALWEILSRPSRGDDIDWKAIADDFNVTLAFLLQQAAWLYDRQLSQVRAQMRKVGNTQSNSPSPALGPGSVSGSSALGGQAMRRVGSGGSRVPSRLSAIQKEGQPLRTESSTPTTATKGKAPVRTNSTTTVTQTQVATETTENPAPIKETNILAGRAMPRRERPSLAVLQRSSKAIEKSPSLSPDSESDSDSELDNDDDDDDDDDDVMASRRLPGARRFGKYSMHKPSLRDDVYDDDEDESPAFLPLHREPDQHMNSTLRQQNDAPEKSRRQMTGYAPSHRRELASLDSSASSGVAVASPKAGPQRQTEPLSPRRVTTLSRESSRQPGSANQSSEETPSMGSSFSDLDDASVTQSALEEALMSNMQHGGVASRMSTISQALRSRYL